MKSVGNKWFAALESDNKTPDLYPALQMILDESRRIIATARRKNSNELVNYNTIIQSAADCFGFTLTSREVDDITYYLESDYDGFGIIQPLVDDPEVSDIIISSYNHVVVQKGRRNFVTGLKFACTEDYEAFVERLLLKAGTTYSHRQPITDGMIDSIARIHAVHKSICSEGPYLTIRINRFSSVQAEDLIRYGLAPLEVVKLLEQYIQAGLTLLLIGEVGTGKTTLSRALAATIPRDESVLVIEDTPEIRLHHPYVRYLQTREENCEGEGRVSPRQCIRAGMRMAMNRIVYGEIRDGEAAEGFIDCCASGHPGLSTIHAKGVTDCVTRLMLFLARAQPGVGKEVLMQQICTAVQVMVHIGVCPQTKTRRILQVREIGAVTDGIIKHRDILHYRVENGRPIWKVANRTSMHLEETCLFTGGLQLQLDTAPYQIEA
jgi:pilus assembly protein CpaF